MIEMIRMKWLKLLTNLLLRSGRRKLARNASPEQLRWDMSRFNNILKAKDPYSRSEPIDLGTCEAYWITAPGVQPERVILYLHGGAFAAELPEVHGAMVAKLCKLARARALYVSYRLAPENRYPAASDDCLAAYRYLLDSGIDPSTIVIAGDSAGGNLTAVTAMRIRDSGLAAPAGLVLLSPALDFTMSSASMVRNDGHDLMFRKSALDQLKHYYADESQERDPYVSPLLGDVRGLPDSLVLAGSSELLLDDSVRYATQAGNVELQVWHDMPHAFPLMPFLPESEPAVREIARFIEARTPSSPSAIAAAA